MNRECIKWELEWFLDEFPDYRNSCIEIYIDKKNANIILEVVKKYKKQIRRILFQIFTGQYNNDLYGKEKTSSKSKDVVAMKIKKRKGHNIRIFCKEFHLPNKKIVMIASISKKEKGISPKLKKTIEKIGGYSYEFQD